MKISYRRMSDGIGESIVANQLLPLVRLRALRSFVSRQGRGYWVHRGAGAASVSIRRTRLACRPFLDAFTPSSFSLVSLSSSEFLQSHHRSLLSEQAATYLGFCPHSTSPRLIHSCGGSQTVRYVLSPGVLNLSTVCSKSGLASLFHLATELRTDLFRDLSTLHSHPVLIGQELPPCR